MAVTGYEIYRNGSKLATVTAALVYTDPSVSSSVSYSYYVIAFDAAGNRSGSSNVLAVTPNVASLGVTINGQLSTGVIGQPQQDITAPTAPTNLAASTFATSATTSSVLLAWSPASDNIAVTGYEIYRNGIKVATVSSTSVYIDPTVTSSVSYSYYVVAFDAAGNRSGSSNVLAVTPNTASLGVTINGQLSSGVIGQPQQDITSPTSPTNLTASTFVTSATTSSVLLAWSASSDNTAVTGYDIYRNGSKLATVTAALVYTDPTVTSTVSYTYYVVAVDAAGNRSGSSNLLVVTPNVASFGVTINGQLSTGVIVQPQQDITAPTSPTNLTATASLISVTTSSVTLTWNQSTDNVMVTGYDIYRNGSKIGTVSSLSLAYTDPSVTTNVAYNYYIVAVDAVGNRSAASNLLTVTPAAASLGVSFSGQISSLILGL
jgi:chitodextrinase